MIQTYSHYCVDRGDGWVAGEVDPHAGIALQQRCSPGESGSCGWVRAKRSSCSLPCSSLALAAPVGVPEARIDAGEEQPLPAALLLMGFSAPGRLPGVAGRLLGLLCVPVE